jgi:hypothetical protein
MQAVGINPATASNEDLGWDPLEGAWPEGDEPTYPVLPGDEFWEAREDLGKIRRVAQALDCSEDPALFGILAWLAGAVPPQCRVNTGILDHRGASLNLGVAVIGQPGAGKSTSQAVRRKLYGSPRPREKFAEGRPGGSGEGLVELYWGTEDVQVTGEDGKTKWKPIRKQIRDNAYVWVPEGAYLFKLNGRKGTTFFEVFRSAIFGESVGMSNASKETTRWLDDGCYSLGYMVGFQPHTAMPLFTEDEINAGSPQRLLFCSPDNLVPEDEPELDESNPFGIADTLLNIQARVVECPK